MSIFIIIFIYLMVDKSMKIGLKENIIRYTSIVQQSKES